MQFKNPKTITKLLLLVGLVSFFFPFVMVSCSGEHVEASGFELMTTISTHEEIEFDSDEDTPNLYLAVAFVCGLLALGAIWDSQSDNNDSFLASCLFSFVGVLFLLLFRFMFWEYYKITDYREMVDVEFRWGWMLSIASYMGASVAAIASYYWDKILLHLQTGNAGNTQVTNSVITHEPQQALETIPPISTQKQVNKTIALSAPPAALQISNLKVHIICRLGAEVNKSWSPSSFPCIIGRNPSSAQIVITDSRVSGTHAKLSLGEESVIVSDENSSNGTFVNGVRISTPTELLTGDIVTVGETELYFEVGA